MGSPYQIDPQTFTINTFKAWLEQRELIPSRRSLKEDLDQHFRAIEGAGIKNLKDLLEALNSKSKIRSFSEDTGLATEYLTLLNREAKSYFPKPVKLSELPGVSAADIEKLEAAGIKNTRHLFELAVDSDQLEQVGREIGVPKKSMKELFGLSDLSRAYGVGPIFARLPFDAGIESLEVYRKLSAEQIIKRYEASTGKKADFSKDEIQHSINLARDLYGGERKIL